MDTTNAGLVSRRELVCQEIVTRLMKTSHPTRDDFHKIKVDVCREFQVSLLKNSEILSFLKRENKKELLRALKSKPIRMMSGVNVIAVMSRPTKCPHGRCVYCPGGPEYNVPQSYTGHEPAAMRGAQNDFEPKRQVKNRMDQLRIIGHDVSKVELIIMGGTFSATDINYQRSFIKDCLDAVTGIDAKSLEEAQHNAEKSVVRNVGITFETRPDYCREAHIDKMLELGVTRVELGVQNVYDDIYHLVGRGHTVQDVINATKVAKDAGMKVCYHMMPGLPGSTIERDLEAFKTLFADTRFMPDMLKVYPCLVLRSAKIYDWWKEGKYKPYTFKEITDFLVEVKRLLPPWVRVMRVQRDIPAKLIEAGVKKGNLRQIVREEMSKRGLRCCCIRCREVGHRMLFDGVTPIVENVQIITRKYEASQGVELFISAEDQEKDVLIGFIRLRLPSAGAHRPEMKMKAAAIVRELHVYGPLVPIGVSVADAWQHRGYGRALIEEAEKASLKNGKSQVLINSALGVREYFERLGYKRVGPYMKKNLN